MSSVVGIDLGNHASKVAVMRNRGIDVAVNDVSNRETPSMVSFNKNQRFMGEAATTQAVSNSPNTVRHMVRLVGKRYDDEVVTAMRESPFCPVGIVEADDGGVLVEVQYDGKPQRFRPQRIVGMLLGNLRRTAQNELGNGLPLETCVLTVPLRYGERERRAVVDAARIIGMRASVINSTTAAALQWGFYKRLEEGQEQTICIIDCGHSSMDVAIIQYNSEGLVVEGSATSTVMCGAEVDIALAEHLADAIQTKYKIDPRTTPRSAARVLAAAEKAKKILSANTEAPVNIECLLNDIDVSTSLSRDDIASICKPLLDEIAPTISAALKMARLSPEQVPTVEVIGGLSWVPAVAARISAAFVDKTLSRTLNASDAVAKGACLRCASTTRRMARQYAVVDVSNREVRVAWKPIKSKAPKGSKKQKGAASGDEAAADDGKELVAKEADSPGGETVVFSGATSVPSLMVLSFRRDEPFELRLQDETGMVASCRVSGMKSRAERQEEAEEITKTQAKSTGIQAYLPTWLGSAFASSEPVVPNVGPNHIEVMVVLSNSGTMHIDSAMTVDAYTDGGGDEVQAATAHVICDPVSGTAGPSKVGEAPPEEARGSTARRSALECKTEYHLGLGTSDLKAEVDHERLLRRKDEEIILTLDSRNELEAFVYDSKERLMTGKYVKFVSEEERKGFVAQLQGVEDWLYTEEGEQTARRVFQSKLNDLKGNEAIAAARAKGEPDKKNAVETLWSVVAEVALLLKEENSEVDEAKKAMLITTVQATEVWAQENATDVTCEASHFWERVSQMRQVIDELSPKDLEGKDESGAGVGEEPDGVDDKTAAAGEERKEQTVDGLE